MLIIIIIIIIIILIYPSLKMTYIFGFTIIIKLINNYSSSPKGL